MQFTWHDSITKSSKSSYNISFDQASMYHNLAAINCVIGYNLVNVSKQYKEAYQKFQNGIAIMEKLNAQLSTVPAQDYTPDFSDAVTLHTLILKGNSHLSFLEFGREKASNPSIADQIAQRAMACSKDFANAYSTSNGVNLKKLLPEKEYRNLLKYNELWFTKEAYQYMALKNYTLASKEIKLMGLAVGYLEQAGEYMEMIVKNIKTYASSLSATITNQSNIFAELYQKYYDENQKIYVQEVEKDKKKLVVEPKYPPNPKPYVLEDIPDFPQIVSGEELKLIEEIKIDLDQNAINPYIMATTMMETQENELLVQLGLPEVLYCALTQSKIPDTVWKKVENFNNMGGTQHLSNLMHRIKSSSDNNQQLLAMIDNEIKLEEEDDNQLRKKYSTLPKEKSSTVNQAYKNEFIRFQVQIEDSSKSDAVIIKQYKEIEPELSLFSQSREELEKLLPKSTSTTEKNPIVEEVTKNMAMLEEIKKQRNITIETLMDMRSSEKSGPEYTKVTKALGSKQELLNLKLAKYRETIEKANNIDREKLLKDIKENMAKFALLKENCKTQQNQSDIVSNLDKLATKVATLLRDINNGLTFYTTISSSISKLKQIVADFVVARNAEKEEILKSLESNNIPKQSMLIPPPIYQPMYQPQQAYQLPYGANIPSSHMAFPPAVNMHPNANMNMRPNQNMNMPPNMNINMGYNPNAPTYQYPNVNQGYYQQYYYPPNN